MKKVFLFTLIFGITLVLWNPALAKKEAGSLLAPTGLFASVVGDMVVEFSFGAGDRTDGGDPSDPNLCVPLADFVAELDEDGTLDPVSGPASAKSSRWQKIADIPEDDFEAHIAEPALYPTFIPQLFFDKNGLNFLF